MPSQLNDTIPTSHEPYLFTVESATQFAKTLKQCDKCYCFMVNSTHHIAYTSNKVAEVNHHNEQMLDKLKEEYLAVFGEPIYPI